MSEHDPGARQPGELNPQALRLEDAARVLSAASSGQVTLEMIQLDVANGAPTNTDGTLNLVCYAAWLVKEMAGAD